MRMAVALALLALYPGAASAQREHGRPGDSFPRHTEIGGILQVTNYRTMTYRLYSAGEYLGSYAYEMGSAWTPGIKYSERIARDLAIQLGVLYSRSDAKIVVAGTEYPLATFTWVPFFADIKAYVLTTEAARLYLLGGGGYGFGFLSDESSLVDAAYGEGAYLAAEDAGFFRAGLGFDYAISPSSSIEVFAHYTSLRIKASARIRTVAVDALEFRPSPISIGISVNKGFNP